MPRVKISQIPSSRSQQYDICVTMARAVWCDIHFRLPWLEPVPFQFRDARSISLVQYSRHNKKKRSHKHHNGLQHRHDMVVVVISYCKFMCQIQIKRSCFLAEMQVLVRDCPISLAFNCALSQKSINLSSAGMLLKCSAERPPDGV